MRKVADSELATVDYKYFGTGSRVARLFGFSLYAVLAKVKWTT